MSDEKSGKDKLHELLDEIFEKAEEASKKHDIAEAQRFHSIMQLILHGADANVVLMTIMALLADYAAQDDEYDKRTDDFWKMLRGGVDEVIPIRKKELAEMKAARERPN